MNTHHAEKVEVRAKLVEAARGLLWLDAETAAAYMGIGKTSLDALRSVLRPSKLGRRKIYNKKRLDEYLDRCAGIKPQEREPPGGPAPDSL